MVRLLAFGLACAAVLGPARAARACATCRVGDPTLVAMGSEQPFRHRTRLSLGFVRRADRVGEPGVDAIRLRDHRLSLAVGHAPLDWLTLTVSLPLGHREVRFPNGAEDDVWALGDLDLRARAVLHRDAGVAPRHILSAVVGVELPTAPRQRDPGGAPLPLEAQVGSGSVDPAFGLTYGFFAAPYWVTASAILLVPTEGYGRARGGPSLRATAGLQVQPVTAFGVGLAAELRAEGPTREPGGQDPNSGGAILYLVPGVVASPWRDLLFTAGVHIPTVQALRGHHREGLAASLGAVLDF